MMIAARDRLIVALDLPSVEAARALVSKLGDAVSFYKIGNTVERGVESVARLGATFLTVHGYPQTMKAALTGKGRSKLKLLAVTVLTSYDDKDLAEASYSATVGDLVSQRASQAREAG